MSAAIAPTMPPSAPPSGAAPEPPVRVEVTGSGQGGALRRHPPVEDLLVQRRPVVGLIGFVPDQRQRAGEALLAQLRRGPHAREGGADDGDAAGAPENVAVVTAGRPGRRQGGAQVRPIDPQGLYRAGGLRPEHLLPLPVAGPRVVPERLVPLHPEHVRREEGTLRIPLAARKVNGESHDASPRMRLAQGLPAPHAGEPFPGAATPTSRAASSPALLVTAIWRTRAFGPPALRPSMRMSSRRLDRDRQSLLGSMRQRNPMISRTSSGSRPGRMVPASSFACSSSDSAVMTGS